MISPNGALAGLQEKPDNARPQNPDFYSVGEQPVVLETQDTTIPQVSEDSLAVAALRGFLSKEFPDMTGMNQPDARIRKIYIGSDRRLFKQALQLVVEIVRDEGQKHLCRLLIDRDYRPIPEEAIVVFETKANEHERKTGGIGAWIANERVYQPITSYKINETQNDEPYNPQE